MAETEQPAGEDLDGSLEQEATTVKDESANNTSTPPDTKPRGELGNRFKALTSRMNIYLLGFIAVILIALIVIFVVVNSQETPDQISLSGQELSQETIDDLLQSDSNIGDATSTLNVEANAIFNGRVLVKDRLDVAGPINIGGPLTLPGITVAGTSQFEDVEVSNNLTILGNASVQGTVSASGLSISGSGSFDGELSATTLAVNNLEFQGDLSVLGHLDAGGPAPSITRGSIGGGGTVSISGTDTAGTVTINTGSGPSSGVMATINFAKAFGGSPHVVISPANANAATLNYYITRTSSSFNLGSTNNPSAGSTFIFNYVAID